MYYLYIDESGDDKDYTVDPQQVIDNNKFFTLAGIAINETDHIHFQNAYKQIIDFYFKRNKITLDSNFKLHYQPLRQPRPPYNLLKNEERWCLPRAVFGAIRKFNCTLFSVTIDKQRHCERYTNPANPTAYALLIILERFQYFVEEKHSTGKVVYERFNAKMRKKAELELKWLRQLDTFPNPTELENLNTKIEYGDPTKEPMLQFADFFAYTPWIRKTTNYNATQKWESIKHKYYNLYGNWLQTGNVEI